MQNHLVLPGASNVLGWCPATNLRSLWSVTDQLVHALTVSVSLPITSRSVSCFTIVGIISYFNLDPWFTIQNSDCLISGKGAIDFQVAMPRDTQIVLFLIFVGIKAWTVISESLANCVIFVCFRLQKQEVNRRKRRKRRRRPRKWGLRGRMTVLPLVAFLQ